MKRWIYYLVPLVFVLVLASVWCPWKKHHEKTLHAVFLDTNWDWQGYEIVSMEPIDIATIEIDIEGRQYLLDDRREIRGTITISGHDSLVYKDREKFYVNRQDDWAKAYNDEYGERMSNQILRASLYPEEWDWDKKRKSECEIYFSTDFEKVMIKDKFYGQIAFGSMVPVDLNELLEYFEGYYSVSADCAPL